MACLTYCVVGFMAQCTVADLSTTMRGALQCYVLEEGSFNIPLASLDLEVTVGEQCAAWGSLGSKEAKLYEGSARRVRYWGCLGRSWDENDGTALREASRELFHK